MESESTLLGLFARAGISREKAAEYASRVHEACPWMAPDQEIAPSIGVELLKDSLDAEILSKVDARSIIDWHNTAVQARHEVNLGFDSQELYAEVCRIVGEFGTEDAYGEGDFWVVDESFATKDLAVIQYKTRVVDPALQRRLSEILRLNPMVNTITVLNKLGDVLYSAERGEKT